MSEEFVKAENISELMHQVSKAIGPMVRSKRAHYGKYVPLDIMLDIIEPELDKHGAWCRFELGVSTADGHVHQLVVEDTDNQGKQFRIMKSKDVSSSGAMTTLTLVIEFKGETHTKGVKAFQTDGNAQEDGKKTTYHSRYLLITAFAVRIVETDPDDVKPVPGATPKASAPNGASLTKDVQFGSGARWATASK